MELDETWSRAAAAEFADRLTDTRNTFDTGRIHDLVVRTIGGWILGGTFGPGAALPREEEMATLFSVSRSTIREANKVLSAKGLIEFYRGFPALPPNTNCSKACWKPGVSLNPRLRPLPPNADRRQTLPRSRRPMTG
jgi:DNA-binding transcriptional MocR family regulator